jgi:tetratricopeptide (TPR) repeat protein
MRDLKDLLEDDLVRRGRAALKSGKYRAAQDLFAEYCDRQIQIEKPISPALLADYATSVAHCGDLKEAAEICFRALSRDRRSPDVFLALARVYSMGSSRKKAIDAVERGMALSPHHPGLVALRAELGVRRAPPIPFLPRDNRWNVWLGRVLDKYMPRRRGRLV